MEWAFDGQRALITTWILFAVAFLCVLARSIGRARIFKKLLFDDYLAVTGLLCLLVNNLIYTVTLPAFETAQDVAFYHHKRPPDYNSSMEVYEKAQWGIAFMYLTGLWAAKGVFLICYGKLTEEPKLNAFRRAWYVLVGYVVLAYIGFVIAYPLLNHLSGSTSGTSRFLSIKYQFAVDLSTDVFITAIPLTIILTVSLPLRRKFVVAVTSGISLLPTTFAIARFALDPPVGRPYGALWVVVWSIVELAVAVIAASIVVLRTLVPVTWPWGPNRWSNTTTSFKRRGEVQSTANINARSAIGNRDNYNGGAREGEGDVVELLERPQEAVLSSPGSSKHLSGVTQLSGFIDEYGIAMV
ncbi:MAG: hypothetical protein M1821_008551 [Bathelium mastoideum]|nr:MAG: hypothetical protein M1821_008551 [Bathelium mastoideum]